jgi:glyoxylase-like metal-dependent hydrolase (beta-lactamase superfamily II)
VLEEVYTKLIGLFSGFAPPTNVRTFSGPSGSIAGFNTVGAFSMADVRFEVLESLGGHQHGHVYFFSPDTGLLFSGDSVINFRSLTEERQKFNLLAKDLMTSVNVDSQKAEQERKNLMELARATDEELRKVGRRCLICGGHGAVSVLENGKLVTFGEIESYRHK